MIKRFSILLLLALIVLIAGTSCYQYVLVPYPMPGSDEEAPTPYDASTPEDVSAMLEAYGQVRLTGDVTLETLPVDSGEVLELDLNGHSLGIDTTSSLDLTNGTTLSLRDGEISVDVEGAATNDAAIVLETGSSIVLNGVDFHSASTGIYPDGDNSTVTIINSTITTDGAYGIATNASIPTPETVSITLINSDVIGNDEGVFMNINGSLTIQGGTIQGGHTGVTVRGGTANISDAVILSRGEFDFEAGSDYYYFDTDWGSGNAVAYAALTVGNLGDGYNYNTNVTVENTRIEMHVDPAVNPDAARIFVSSGDGESTNLTIDNLDYAAEIVDKGMWYGSQTWLNSVLLEEEP